MDSGRAENQTLLRDVWFSVLPESIFARFCYNFGEYFPKWSLLDQVMNGTRWNRWIMNGTQSELILHCITKLTPAIWIFMNGTKRVYERIILDTKRGNECFTDGTRWNKMSYARNTTEQVIYEWNTEIAWICIPVIYEAARCKRPVQNRINLCRQNNPSPNALVDNWQWDLECKLAAITLLSFLASNNFLNGMLEPSGGVQRLSISYELGQDDFLLKPHSVDVMGGGIWSFHAVQNTARMT